MSFYRNKAFYPGINDAIKEHVTHGCSIRAIAVLLQISATTVLKKIILIGQAIAKPGLAKDGIYEMDEICTFVRSKSQRVWIAYAFCRQSGNVADFAIGPRSLVTLGCVTNTLRLSFPTRVYTDKLRLYKSCCPKVFIVHSAGARIV